MCSFLFSRFRCLRHFVDITTVLHLTGVVIALFISVYVCRCRSCLLHNMYAIYDTQIAHEGCFHGSHGSRNPEILNFDFFVQCEVVKLMPVMKS